MGSSLTQPVTEKLSNQGQGLGLRYGLSSMQGWRPEMEDTHDIKIGLEYGLDDWSFFAVFDGHAGKCAAAYASTNLLDFILRESQFELGAEECVGAPYLGPNGESSNEAQKLERSSNPSPKDQSNGDEKSSGSTNQNVNSSDHLPECEPGGLSEHPIHEREPHTNKDQSHVDGEKLEGDGKLPKAKFASFPVLKQLDMVKNAIKSGFLRVDQSMRSTAKDMSGCTAVCAFISTTHLFIANCGDSRAVLYDGTSPKFITEDHKPYNPKERKRIIDAGGTATQRVNGTLAVSRALGDFEFKKDIERGPCEQLVSPEPEVTVIERHPTDEFLILACDGIWDVMDNDDLCQYVRYELTIEPNLENVCSSVLDVCLRKGSRDNMSIILVVFETGPKVCGSDIERDKKNTEILLEIADSLQEKDSTLDFSVFLHRLDCNLGQQSETLLPPGAGIEAKYDLLHDRFEANLEKFQVKNE